MSATRPRPIPATGLRGREGYPYLPDPGLLAAGNVALTLQIPLLLTGEPGCGKTEFASAVAGWMGHRPLACHVHSDSRSRDLLYRYDAERRFGDAQHGGPETRARAGDARHYVELRGLGLALMSPVQRVVLIDEIDKAPRDLPNDLLRELDEFRFTIGELDEHMVGEVRWQGVPLRRDMEPPAGAPRPLVIITSNVERQLPDPFLRRCAFYHIRFPGTARLLDIVKSRFPGEDPSFLERAVQVFEAMRAVPHLNKKPATSELIHWVDAIGRVYEPEAARRAVDELYDDLGRGPAWGALPGLSCLVKLREDLDLLGAAG